MAYYFTTGSCSAAAAKAAAYMLLSGQKKESIVITTPKGIDFHAELLNISIREDQVSCGVLKDGGEDPDVTTGFIITATVSYLPDHDLRETKAKDCPHIQIDGGEGVGRVHRPGLDQPVGNAAINSVPRQMIQREVREVMNLFDCHRSLKVIISVPGGEKLAKRTFNPRLGIEGGISILGTSGIVEPMSTKALLDTIRVQLHQKHVLGKKKLVISPGNYGLDFMRTTYGYDLEEAVKCSNYIGETLEIVASEQFTHVLLCGHIGKLVKLAGGIMNTHSAEADCRIELMVNAALAVGLPVPMLRKMQECISTDAAYQILVDANLTGEFMDYLIRKIKFYLDKRAAGRFTIECIVFSNEFGLMGKTAGADQLLKELKDE